MQVFNPKNLHNNIEYMQYAIFSCQLVTKYDSSLEHVAQSRYHHGLSWRNPISQM